MRDQADKKKRYLRVSDLEERWGVSKMTVERVLRKPDFMKYATPIRLPGSRIRLLDETGIEQYERAAARGR
jgi:hypothetical protein